MNFYLSSVSASCVWRKTSAIVSAPGKRSIKPSLESAFSSRVTASRWMATRLAKPACLRARERVTILPRAFLSSASHNSSACILFLTASTLNSTTRFDGFRTRSRRYLIISVETSEWSSRVIRNASADTDASLHSVSAIIFAGRGSPSIGDSSPILLPTPRSPRISSFKKCSFGQGNLSKSIDKKIRMETYVRSTLFVKV